MEHDQRGLGVTHLQHDDRKIRVLIVDDHEMVRSGLVAFMQGSGDLEAVGEASSGEEAIELCLQLAPDVVLMDMMMPGIGGVDATRAIHQKCPRTRILALTSFPEEGLVQQALQAGAISYLLKNVASADLACAIREAVAGRPTLAPEATQALIRQATRPVAPGHDLSPREREVLKLMKLGLGNKAIGDELSISRSTVDFHVSNILSKLGVGSRTEAVAVAIQNQIVD